MATINQDLERIRSELLICCMRQVNKNERIRSAIGALVCHLASKRNSAYDRNTLHEHACFVQSGIKGLKYPDATVP